MPPRILWTGTHFDLFAQTGAMALERALSRHAGIGLFLELRREIQRSEGEGIRAILSRLEAGIV